MQNLFVSSRCVKKAAVLVLLAALEGTMVELDLAILE